MTVTILLIFCQKETLAQFMIIFLGILLGSSCNYWKIPARVLWEEFGMLFFLAFIRSYFAFLLPVGKYNVPEHLDII